MYFKTSGLADVGVVMVVRKQLQSILKTRLEKKKQPFLEKQIMGLQL